MRPPGPSAAPPGRGGGRRGGRGGPPRGWAPGRRAGGPRRRKETIEREGLVTHASIPLVARDQVVGVLNVAADVPREFPEGELQLLSSIGRPIGVAVDNSRPWDQVQ